MVIFLLVVNLNDQFFFNGKGLCWERKTRFFYYGQFSGLVSHWEENDVTDLQQMNLIHKESKIGSQWGNSHRAMRGESCRMVQRSGEQSVEVSRPWWSTWLPNGWTHDLNQYRFLIQSFHLQKASGWGVRTHPPMVLLAMVREKDKSVGLLLGISSLPSSLCEGWYI